MPERQMAVIKNFTIGVGDRGVPSITFDTYLDTNRAALQVIYGSELIYDFIAEAGLSDVTTIDGQTCWVTVEDGMIRFEGLTKL